MGEAWSSSAAFTSSYDWNWKEAEVQFRRALKPGYSIAHYYYASHLLVLDRVDEALESARRAAELDPLSPMLVNGLAAGLYSRRDYGGAARVAREALQLDPNYAEAYCCLARALCRSDRSAEAIELLLEAGPAAESPMGLGTLAEAYGLHGDRRTAKSIMAKLRAMSHGPHVPAFSLALAHIGAGKWDSECPCLEKACDERCVALTAVRCDPRFESVRGDPRLHALIGKMKLNTLGQ